MISVVEQCSNATLCPQFGGIPNLVYRLHQPLQQGFENHQIGTLAQMRASASYTGRAQPEVRLSGQRQPPEPELFQLHPVHSVRFNNGVPNRLTQTAVFPAVKFQRNILMTSFYAQDTYTRSRLTLQGGIRYDGIGTGYPDTGVGGPDYQLMPTRIFYAAGTTDEIHWKDITPRVGAVRPVRQRQDGVKVNIGKYLTALTASNSDLDLHPLIRTTLRRRGRGTTRRRSRRATREAGTTFRTATWSTSGQWRVRPHGQPELRQGDVHEVLRP